MNLKALYEIVVQELANWFESFVEYLPNVVVALVVFFTFYMIAKWCSRVFGVYIGKRMKSRTMAGLVTYIFKLLIIFLGVYFAVKILNFQDAITSILAGAGIMGLVLGLAFQELITNVISGVSLTIKKYFHLGDQISINNQRGFAEKLDLRAMVMRGLDGQEIIVPNKTIMQSVVKNYYSLGKLRKELYIGISCSEDVEKITGILEEAIGSLEFLAKENRTEVLCIDIDGLIMKLLLRYWVIYPIPGMNDRVEEHFSIMAIKKAFDKSGMALPTYVRNREFIE